MRQVKPDSSIGVIYALASEDDGTGAYASKVGRGSWATARQYTSRSRHSAGLRPIASAIVERGGRLSPEWCVLMSSKELVGRREGERWTRRLSELLELVTTAVLCTSIKEFHGCGGRYGDAYAPDFDGGESVSVSVSACLRLCVCVCSCPSY